MLTTWEPLTGRAVELPEWDARGAYLRLQDSADVRLTLAVREEIQGRTLRCQDQPGEPWYCECCLADLPGDILAQLAHECGEAPAVEHKTRTSQPSGYVQSDGVRRFGKRGRVMYDRGSFAFCSCGWVGAGADRREARSLARQHRESAA